MLRAIDVFTIAKALPEEELYKLYEIISSELKLNKSTNLIQNRNKGLPKFTVDDGVKYLINNHLKKNN